MSSYGRAAPPHHNYELFSIVRLVGISNQLGNGDIEPRPRGGRGSISKGAGVAEEQRVTIQHVAAGGYVDHSFVAMALSNDTIIFRFVGDSGVPLVRQMPWTFKDQHDKHIVAMSFNPTAQWLMALAADATVVLVPIYFLMCKKSMGEFEEKAAPIVVNEKERFERLSSLISSPSSWFGKMTGQHDSSAVSNGKRRLNDVTVLTIGASKQLDATHCVWWKTWNGGDYGIISSSHGSIIIINFFNEEIQYKHKLKFPVIHMDIVQDSAKSYKYLLLHTKNGGYWKILLEHEIDFHMYETIVDVKAPNAAQFAPVLLTRFAPEISLTVQHTAQGSIIAAYNRASAKLEIYDPEPGKFALFVYQLPAGTAMFHFTSKLTFVVGSTAADAQETGAAPESDLSRIAVISNLIAGTTVNPRWFLRHQIQSIMQQFSLPPKEKVKGMLSYDSPHSVESAEGNFYVWTTNGLYEIRQKMSPEKIFFQLLAKGLEKTDAEPFGKTFRLDLFTLYEQAADREFDAGNYGRALDLYYLSNVRTSKLIGKYLDIGRMDIVMTHLKGTLHQPEALPVGDRKMLSDILFQCYLQKLLASKEDFKPLEHEFHTFLALNQDYDAGKALVMLLNSGLTDYFLEVANSRKLMPTALNILVNRGSLFLDLNQIDFLKAGCANELKTCGGGSIFQCLPTELQIKLILEDPSSIPRNVRRINLLISFLDEQTLLDIAHCFDPLGDNIHLILNADTSPINTNAVTPPTSPVLSPSLAMSQDSIPDTQIRPEEYLELFITALLCLNHKRAQRKSPTSILPSLRLSRSQSLRVSRSASITLLSGPPRSPSLMARPIMDLDVMPPGFGERKAVKIACGWHHACFITESGELYTWGKNTTGQLGHGSTTKLQTSPKRVDALRGVAVAMVSCGGEHTVIADQLHSVYSWGDGKFGQLGLGMKQMQPLPRKMEALQGVKIRQIACGHSHTVFLTKSGEVYSCGHGEQGQLGLGGLANKLAPTRVEAQEIAESGKGASIACGHCHTVLCTEAGDVYSWGAGARGQLGHGTLQSYPMPKLVNSLRGKHIRSVACGPFHTIAISDLNNVYSWGQGKFMRLGHGGDRDEFIPRIVEILMNKNVRSAACGQIHTAALCTEPNGDAGVYVWGGADNGRLGLGDDIQFCKPLPTLISSLSGSRVTAVACGEDFTLVCTEAGTLFAWGSNTHGQLGQGDVNNCSIPIPIPTSMSDRASRTLGASMNDISSDVVYGQDNLEATLKTQLKHYRHGIVLARCSEYGNFAAAATIYDELKDDANALDCRLQAITSRFHSRPYDPSHPTATTPPSPPSPATPESDSDITLSPDSIKSNTTAKLRKETNMKEEVRLVLQLVTIYICKADTPRNIKEREKSHLGREYLLLQILQYWKSHSLPIEPLEAFIVDNLTHLSDPLSHILENPPSPTKILTFSPPRTYSRLPHPSLIQTPPILTLSSGNLTENSLFTPSPPTPPKPPESLEKVLPWVMDFSSQLYTKVVHFTLQKMVQDTEKETPVSEAHLWEGIKENMEKEVSRREAIVIQHLSSPSASVGGSKVHDSADSKDVAFTCGHHMTRRALIGHVVPQLLQRLELFPVPIPATTRLIVACYKLKMIPLACPMCLYNYMREAVPNGDSLRVWQV